MYNYSLNALNSEFNPFDSNYYVSVVDSRSTDSKDADLLSEGSIIRRDSFSSSSSPSLFPSPSPTPPLAPLSLSTIPSASPTPSPLPSQLSQSLSAMPSSSSSPPRSSSSLTRSYSPSIAPQQRKKKGRSGVTMSFYEFSQMVSPTVVERFDAPKEVKVVRPVAATKISLDNTKPQLVSLQHLADKILFSQDYVSDYSTEGKTCITLDTLADQLFVSFQRSGALDVVANPDGTFTSVDNRRLLIAKRISQLDRNYSIYVRVHKASQVLKEWEQRRFTVDRFVPTTWGEAVQKRINKSGVLGFVKEPRIGTSETPTISISLSDLDLSALHKEDAGRLLTGASRLTYRI